MKKSLRLFMIIGAAVMLAFFFVPTVKLPEEAVSEGGFTWEEAFDVGSVSGLKALTGIEMSSRIKKGIQDVPYMPEAAVAILNDIISIRGVVLALVKLVCPVLIGILWFTGKNENRGKLSGIFSLAHAGVCVAFIFIVKSMLVKWADRFAGFAAFGGSQTKVSVPTPGPNILLFAEVAIALFMAVLSFLIASGKLSENETNMKVVTAALGDAGKNAGAVAAAVGQGVKQSVNHAKAQAASQRRCQNCGAILDAGSDFCGSCGTKYAAQVLTRCAKCGTELEEADAFCPLCGAKQEKKKERLCMHCGNTFSDDFAFCPHCGKEYVDPEKRVCGNCGAALPVGTDFCGKCGTRYE